MVVEPATAPKPCALDAQSAVAFSAGLALDAGLH